MDETVGLLRFLLYTAVVVHRVTRGAGFGVARFARSAAAGSVIHAGAPSCASTRGFRGFVYTYAPSLAIHARACRACFCSSWKSPFVFRRVSGSRWTSAAAAGCRNNLDVVETRGPLPRADGLRNALPELELEGREPALHRSRLSWQLPRRLMLQVMAVPRGAAPWLVLASRYVLAPWSELMEQGLPRRTPTGAAPGRAPRWSSCRFV